VSSGTRTWEYRSVFEPDAALLADFGSDGWELVAVTGDEGRQRFHFKRPGLDFRERVTLEQKARYYAMLGVAEATGEAAR